MWNKVKLRSGEVVDRQPKSAKRALEALRFLCSKMERSEGDARRSLEKWMVDRSEWEEIIEALKQEKFIDHNRYARCYVNEKMNYGSWGARKISAGLRAKGIEREIIESTIAELMNNEQVDDRLAEQMSRKYKQLMAKPHKNEYELRTKILSWGAYRGYDFDVIGRVLDRVIEEYQQDDEED